MTKTCIRNSSKNRGRNVKNQIIQENIEDNGVDNKQKTETLPLKNKIQNRKY